ncbi:hypothetical protein R3I94_003925 [Phoxinus phoxinus]
MFGQKPKLPVDHLLGRSDEPEEERTPSDWVAQHQEYLSSVYTSARRHLESAAERRRAAFPQFIAILTPGTLVYCRNHFHGRHKIQDVWNSIVFEIVTCNDEVGTLYKIRPQGKDGPIKIMHRSELKLVPHGTERPVQPIRRVSFSSFGPDSDASTEEPEVESQPQVAVVYTRVGAQVDASPQLLDNCISLAQPTRDRSPVRSIREPTGVQFQAITEEQESDLVSNVDVPVECPVDQSVGQPEETSPSLRRSTRRTAGQHQNPFHLSQSLAQNGSSGIAEVSSHTTPFRPWQ